MLDEGSDIYAPVSVSHSVALIALLMFVGMIVAYFGQNYIRRHLALKKQASLTTKVYGKQNEVIQAALDQIEQVRRQVSASTLSIGDAAFQVSSITRGAFDQVMNHTTRYQSRDELRHRFLSRVADSLDYGYLLEFDDLQKSINSPSQLESMIAISREVLESCR